MPDEIGFCRQRLSIVKGQLEDHGAIIDREDRLRLEREHRLLGHILYELQEGQVLRALRQWRSHFGQALAEHKADHRGQQEAFDNWWRLPPDKRGRTPKPEPPSLGVRVTSRSGQVFVIDDRYLAMMDDLIRRLEMWHESSA